MSGVPWSRIHAAVHQQLLSRSLLPQRATVLVAVSGGQDSVCLLKLLSDLRPKWSWQLRIVHCDHRWRADSKANAEFVQQLCEAWKLPCQIVTAGSRATDTEAAARQWRYQGFEDAALQTECSHVVTGHTASDRAETLLYNLLRGSGTDGLQALAWERSLRPDSAISVVRPLLAMTRQQTEEFCRQFDLPIWQDSTNQDTRYARNRIRLELLPYLKHHFNPGAEATLAHTAELLTAEVDLLETMAEELYEQTVAAPAIATAAWSIQRLALRAAPLALQRRVLRRVLQQAIAVQVSFNHVEKLVALLGAANGSQSDPFPGGAIAVVEGDWVRVKRRQKGEGERALE
ncbi:MAG: tRNA lysidine(34) synthetase TilS [Nodosilinea sp.]